ncbi:MAG: alpha-amylase family glycosyl hydrolase, partial [Synechococcus sp. H1_metabat_bins_2.tsv.006]|nr:alpha-amylase family glycosyl hydrolase [Synechococcus sp. H1_metabat_bins_2.tsv.006]
MCIRDRNPDYPLQPRSSEELLSIWSATRAGYRPEVNRAQLNLLDSHDVPRALHSLNGDLKALKLALLLLFLQPGAPCIYYGTEAGLAGGPSSERSSGPEPACREAFPWDKPWSADLTAYIHQLAELRRQHAVIQQGELSWRSVGSDGLVAQAKGLEIWINRSRQESLALPDLQASAEMHWSTEEATAVGSIAAQSAALLLTTPR